MYMSLEKGASESTSSNCGSNFNSSHWWKEKIHFLRGFCLNVGVKHRDVDDVVQEICVKLSRVSVPVRHKNWLCILARNVVSDFYRREQKRKPLSDSSYIFVDGIISVNEEVEVEPATPTKDVLEVDFQTALYDEIDKLGEHQRDTMALYALGFDYQMISDLTGVPIGTVRSRLFYGKRRLKKRLESFM